MPYADIDRRRAYNAAWWRTHPEKATSGPLAQDVVRIVREHGPCSPAFIVSELGRSNANAVSVCLHRLRRVGRVRRIGYGRWMVAVTALVDRRVSRILRAAASIAHTGVDPRIPVVCLECDDSLFPDDGYTAVVDGVRGFVCAGCNSKDFYEAGAGAILDGSVPAPAKGA